MKVSSIAKIRELKGISPDDMAIQLEMSERQYRRYETGESDWSLTLLEAVAKHFKMTVPEMLSFDEKVFFSQCAQAHAFGSNNTYNAASEKERELYEARINALELDVRHARGEAEFLRGQLAAALKK